jgi:UDP-N-acetylmuramoylalanine--D-glutamate ligase
MIPARSFANATCAVFGLGLTGTSAARALLEGGARVLAWDDQEISREKARQQGLPVEDLYKADWGGIDCLVLSPGVPLTHPEPHAIVKMAHRFDVPVIGDTEIMVREIAASGARLVAITGTNGKSTVTALLGHVLQKQGLKVEVGGNIGTFAVLELGKPTDETIYVIEFSSYQIDLTPSLKPDVAICLNLSPDHLDRHGSMENYARVKARIFALQNEGDTAIVGVDDSHGLQIRDALLRRGQKPVSISQSLVPEKGYGVIDGILYGRMDGNIREMADITRARALRGAHNGQNAAAVFAACRALGLESGDIAAGLMNFPGLEHRMEEVGRIGNVLFINDSKGTNAQAAAKALGSFDDIYWIAGGRSKAGGIEPLKPLFSRIRKAYLIGEAAEDFAATLKGQTPCVMCGTLKTALERAAKDAGGASGNPVVLLSPACASFDQYPSFGVRGDEFRSLVRQLGQGET